LTLTQEQNVKVFRSPHTYLDETIPAHTNVAEVLKFLLEKGNEAFPDRLVSVKVPDTLSYVEEARIYDKPVSAAPAFGDVHLDPHALRVAAVFAVLTRLVKPEREGMDLSKKLRLYAGESVEGFPETEVTRLRTEAPEEGLTGVSPRFIVNSISNAITRN